MAKFRGQRKSVRLLGCVGQSAATATIAKASKHCYLIVSNATAGSQIGSRFDVVIVGAGLFGATCAHELTRRGLSCLILEKRPHIGGNCYSEERDGIHVHMYGPHISILPTHGSGTG